MNHTNNFFVALIAALSANIPTYALLTARSVPPESFLDYHVDTVPQLTFEVTYDKTVRARLARHFHLSGRAMSAYVRDNLVLERLRAPLRTRVYAVTSSGREHFVVMTLRTGTPVFALRRTGQPILRRVCGNPLVSALPPVPKKVVAAKPALKAAKPFVKTLVEPSQMTLITDTPAEALPAAWSVPSVTNFGSATLFTKAATSLPGWLPLLPIAGGAALLPPSHGGGGGTPTVSPPGVSPTVPPVGGTGGTPTEPVVTQPVVPIGPPPGPEPVPEPSPIWVFALGGLGVGLLRLTKRRSGTP